MTMMRKVKKMSRPIDADALWMDIIHCMDVCDDILEIIERQPTIEPERKTGNWLPDNINYYEERYVCSECKISYKVDTCMGEPLWNFCPNCGADMRQEGERDE